MTSATFLPNTSEPEALVLPPISVSLPCSRSPSRLPSPTRIIAASVPTSPIAKTRLFKPAPPKGSPARYTRTHKFHATFTSALRPKETTRCPVHSYVALAPISRRGSAVFGTAARAEAPASACPQHAYETPASTLSRMGATAFSQEKKGGDAPTSGPPVHAYAAPSSMLSRMGATAFSQEKKGGEIATSGPPVHAYETPASTLSRMGATAFSQEKKGGEVPTSGRAPVHAYAAPASTLRRAGAVPFGSTASRGLDLTLTRTGLLSATVTPRVLSRGVALARKPTTLPKLVPRRAPSPTAVEDALAEGLEAEV